MEYRTTLNLPKTGFAMKAGLAQREPKQLADWHEAGLYQALRKQSKGKPKFVLHDGPPYANGHIHLGHALNKILKDIIVKYKTMQGYDSPYVPGWDCHGLPIEHQLFKELKTDKSKVDRVEFRKKAHAYAMKFVDIQKEEFKRLGIFGEWDNPYLTLTPEYEYWILQSLAVLNKKGYLYRGLKPVNWCFACETALAEAEVEYDNHTSPSVYVKFAVDNPQEIKGLPKDKKLFLLVWTTTPWTLVANVAVAVHDRYHYVIVEVGGDLLAVEKSLSHAVLAKQGIEKFTVIEEVTGKDLQALTYAHPLGLRAHCPVVTVDYVTREEGTGLVHTAPGHGQEDHETGLKYKLDMVMPVDSRGCFTDYAGEFAGSHVFKANEKITARLKDNGTLFCSEPIEHSYPHCWRCKKPIIFRSTEQWFLSVDHAGLRGKLAEIIKNDVQWIPAAGKERILAMVVSRPDWCLSRQRYWGVPIPAFICRGCGEAHKLFPEVVEHFAQIARSEGSDAWFLKDVKELVPKGFVCPDCKKSDFEKTSDILDVWFDSGVSHQAVVKGMMNEQLPASLYLEGSDQHRGWFQSSLIPAVAIEGKAPYRAVLTHGFTVDGEGRKMSKSMGNVIAPQDVMKNYGADILRLWVAASTYTEDVRLSKEILERLIDAYRKIRNTIRFMLSNLYDFNPDTDTVSDKQLLDIDKWAMHQLQRMLVTVNDAYEDNGTGVYAFDKMYRALYLFCNEEMSGFYLDILKDRLYTSAAKSPQRRSAQTVLYTIVDALVRLMAPVLAFTAEEVFAAMPKSAQTKDMTSVHLLSWPQRPQRYDFSAYDKQFKAAVELRPHVLRLLEEKRQAGTIGSSLDARLIFETASARDFDGLKKCEQDLRYLFIVSDAQVRKVGKVAEGIGEEFSQTRVIVEKADGTKCDRCWNYSVHVGDDNEHATLCERCVAAIKEMNNAA